MGELALERRDALVYLGMDTHSDAHVGVAPRRRFGVDQPPGPSPPSPVRRPRETARLRGPARCCGSPSPGGEGRGWASYLPSAPDLRGQLRGREEWQWRQ